MNTVEQVTEKFGGAEALAALIGKPPTTTAHWKRVGRIPVKWHPVLLDLAQKQEIQLSKADLLTPIVAPVELPIEPPALAVPAKTSSWANLREHWSFIAGGMIVGGAICLLAVAVGYYAVANWQQAAAAAADPVHLATPAPHNPKTGTAAGPRAGAMAQWFLFATHGDWKTQCHNGVTAQTKKTMCVGTLEVRDTKLGENVILWIVGHDKKGVLAAILKVPSGVTIESGVGLQLDRGETRRLNLMDCSTKKCTVAMTLDDNFLQAARAATTASITISPLGASPLTVQISMGGFAQMLNDLQ